MNRVIVVVVCAAAVLGVGLAATRGAVLPPTKPIYTTRMPNVIPPNGVNIENEIELSPPLWYVPTLVSKAQAVQDAKKFDGTHSSPTALLARVTVPGSTSIRDVTAWVVTFTSHEPIPYVGGLGGDGNAPKLYHHDVVIDALSGGFVVGFETK